MNPISNIPGAPCQTLADTVDEYLINRQIDKKKYFLQYLVTAKRVWQNLFWNTIWVVKNEWKTLQAGTPYNYIDMPFGCARLFTVSEVDHHNKIIPLFYDDQINIIAPPASPHCGCQLCDCTGSQDELSGLTFSTSLLFTINGVDYFEKTWLKVCSNGDILKYREVPTKKYNDFRGTSGDFNNDFNDDFSNANSASANFEIVTQKFQEKICTLAIRPCGCPDNTPENQALVENFCGCFKGGFNGWFRNRGHHGNPLFENINNNERGSIKISKCGTKIYYIPSKHCDHVSKMPTNLLVAFQPSGLISQIDGAVTVPDFSLEAMFTGIHYGSMRFNFKYSESQKLQAKWEHNDAVNKIIMFLNPISLDWLQNVQDREVIW